MKSFYLLILSLCLQNLSAQVLPSSGKSRLDAWQAYQNLAQKAEIPFQNIGPSIMGGRVVDLEVNEKQTTHFYVAYASGGLWKTENNGTTFHPLFDKEACMTIGDIAVNWANEEQIWVGTGENNSSRSSYSGTGIYYSKDKGKTWQHKGLEETAHIGRIVLHPQNPAVLWVAAIGNLYSKNTDRGVFKSIDGGNSWQKVLYINDSTGVIDLVLDPQNPNVLYAAAWQRMRSAAHFDGDGVGSAIYKSENGGESWTLCTTDKSGFPTGEKVGRIGLAISPKNSQKIYAVLDNQAHRPKEEKGDSLVSGLKRSDFKTMSKVDFLALDNKKIQEYLRKNRFPNTYTAEKIKLWVKEDKISPSALDDYLSDANNDLFDTPVIGAEVYLSENGGKTWQKKNSDYLEDFYFSYGYYFGQIRVAPQNEEEIYILGVTLLHSTDGGKTFEALEEENVHGDHHALWLNPNLEGHFILGNDGGVNMSYDSGASFLRVKSPPVAQFYAIAVDSLSPYHVLGGLQDNGVWRGNRQYSYDTGWQFWGEYPYQHIYDGDGMQVQVDPRNPNLVYTGYQYGYYARLDLEKKGMLSIKPEHTLGEKPLRFQWQTPIHLSRHNPDVLYLGANKVFRSLQKGEKMAAISPDLTENKKQSNVPFHTLTCITESPLKFGYLYAGADDGSLWHSNDGGEEWISIQKGLPKGLYVSRIEPSRFALGRLYLSLNAYRNDNMEAHLYVSQDAGKNWERIALDLPLSPINVVREDPANPKLLYIGTDNGLFVSWDAGKTCYAMNGSNLPQVAVHDLLIHTQTHELVVGTHGRSLYVASIYALQQLNDSVLDRKVAVLSPKITLNHSENWELGKNEPSISLTFYQKEKQEISVEVVDEKGSVFYSERLSPACGIRTWAYHAQTQNEKKPFLTPKKYEIRLKIGKEVVDKSDLIVE